MTTYDIAEMLGGGQVFVGRVMMSDLDLVEAVRDGLPMAAVIALVQKSALSMDEVEPLVFSGGASAERLNHDKLTPDESDRLARVARITRHRDDWRTRARGRLAQNPEPRPRPSGADRASREW